MIIPQRNEVLLSLYECPVCNGMYQAQTGDLRISCAVNHPPGTCCHYGEKEISKETYNKIKTLLKETL